MIELLFCSPRRYNMDGSRGETTGTAGPDTARSATVHHVSTMYTENTVASEGVRCSAMVVVGGGREEGGRGHVCTFGWVAVCGVGRSVPIQQSCCLVHHTHTHTHTHILYLSIHPGKTKKEKKAHHRVRPPLQHHRSSPPRLTMPTSAAGTRRKAQRMKKSRRRRRRRRQSSANGLS